MDTTEHGPEGDLTDLERRLSLWRPATGGLDRDRVLFEAGRVAGRSEVRARVRTGLVSTAALALIAVGLGVLLVRERARRHVLEVQIARQVPAPTAPAPTEPTPPPIAPGAFAPDSYLALTHRMADGSLDDAPGSAPGMPTEPAPTDTDPTLRVRDVGRLLKF